MLVELSRRPPPPGFHSSREAIAAELPKLLDLVHFARHRRSRVDYAKLRANLCAKHHQYDAQVARLPALFARWGLISMK